MANERELQANGPPDRGFLSFGALAFVVLAVVSLPFDLGVARTVSTHRIGGDVIKFLQLSETFAHGTGVILILIAMRVLDPDHRRFIPRVVACAFAPGIAANILKQTVGRWRPRWTPEVDHVQETFIGWFPWLHDIDFAVRQGHRMQSFPSGHAATAVGLAIGLSFVYPRGRYLFATFATFAAFERILDSHHYLSDVLFGTAVGLIVGAQFVGTTWASQRLHGFEARTPGSSTPAPTRVRSLPA